MWEEIIVEKVLAITGATAKKSGVEFMRYILGNYDELKNLFGGRQNTC